MGCAPSNCHRSGAFHNTVVPMPAYPIYQAWDREPAYFEYEPMQVQSQPAHGHCSRLPNTGDDPPPYTEVALDGHVTLMRASPIKQEDHLETSVMSLWSDQLDESTFSAAMLGREQVHDTNQTSPQFVERSSTPVEQGFEHPHFHGPGNTSFHSFGEATELQSSTSATTSQDAGRHSVLFPPRPPTLSRSLSVGHRPLYSHLEAPNPPLNAQTLIRRESYPRGARLPVHLQLEQTFEPQTTTSAVPLIFPPRPGVSSRPPSNDSSILPPLRPVTPLNHMHPHPISVDSNGLVPTHVRPSSVRLPPIEQQSLELSWQQQATQEQGKPKLRKRRRRKRGNTWHGESLLAPAVPVEAGVVADP